MAFKSNASEILKQLREMIGKTQAEVANDLGRTGAWLSNLENSTRNIKAHDLGVLADYYRADISLFYESQVSLTGIGLLIERALKKNGMTVKELSDTLDLDYFRICKCMDGELELSPNELEQIGQLLNIDEPPFVNYADYEINRILSYAGNLGLKDKKLSMLKSFLEDEIKK